MRGASTIVATMAQYSLLRFHEVRDAYRLIGECRDLGTDPTLWQTRLAEGLRELVGVRWAAGSEGFWAGTQRIITPLSVVAVGHSERELLSFRNWFRAVGPQACPIFQALERLPGQLLTHSRSRLVPDRTWYRSASFLHRDGLSDHVLTSLRRVEGSNTFSVLGLYHPPGARDFSSRQEQLVDFLHGELGPLIGRALVSASEPSPTGLSPRMRQTLSCLLEGDSEKQVAVRLGLSQTTTHQYVTALYRHFGVRSRAQLLVHVLRRRARASWREVLSDTQQT